MAHQYATEFSLFMAEYHLKGFDYVREFFSLVIDECDDVLEITRALLYNTDKLLKYDVYYCIEEYNVWSVDFINARANKDYAKYAYHVRQLNWALKKNAEYKYGVTYCDDDDFKGM